MNRLTGAILRVLYFSLRDSVQDDAYFPQFRSFDWFCGHSWARGLLFAYDGKDQVGWSCHYPYALPYNWVDSGMVAKFAHDVS